MPLPVVPPPLPADARQGSLAATLQGLAPGARPSEVWRGAAFALLRVNPKECEELALAFEDDAATDERRTLVLDLLAGAGTFEAQVVIRRLLALAVARRESRTFAVFVQRLGFVDCPDGPTLRFLMSVYAESRGEPHDVRAACAYALGAAAGRALAAGDPDAAVRASDVLRRDLPVASTAAEKCALLTALGNAGLPADLAVLARSTYDAEVSVRAAAALALRKLGAPEARARLVELLTDHDNVARSALAALAEHKLCAEDLERLADLVLAGRSAPATDGAVLRLLVAQRAQLTSSSARAGAVEQALRLLLERIEAGGAPMPIAGSGERRVVSPRASESGLPAAPAARTASAPALSPAVAETVLDAPLRDHSAYTRVALQPPRAPAPAAVVSGSYRIVTPACPAPVPNANPTRIGPYGNDGPR
jgi:HEAT repeat protein